MTFLIVLFLLLPFFVSSVNQRVLLRDVTSITLRRGEYTAGRRSSPIPQLQCVGGSAYGAYSPKVVQCYNRGFDGVDVQWECKAQMGADFDFGKIEVSCEGYDYPEDPFILAGSCGLKYELDYTTAGVRRHASAPYSKPTSDYIIYFVIAAFVVYLIYTTLTSSRDGNEGDRRRGGSGFDQGPGYPPGGPPPPGWRHDPPPSYDSSTKYSTTGASAPSGGVGGGGSSGPGFFTGLGLGGLGGYLFGRNTNHEYGGTYRRRNRFSQYERDTGFYDDAPGNYRSHDEPSTSHESTGFGGTTRR